MAKNEYIARRPFASLDGGSDLVQAGQVVTIRNKNTAKDMQNKGLIWPNYKTKEDKEAMKVQKKSEEKATIKHDAGPMFFVLQGDKIIDRLKKSEAEQLRDKINGVSA